MRKLILCIFTLLIATVAHGEIIFQDNFDNHADWTVNQTDADSSNCWPNESNMPSANPLSGPRYIGYNSSRTYLTGNQGAGHNTLNINSNNHRGPSGKGVTYWCEVPDFNQPFEASDGVLYITLTDTPGGYGYDEIWIQVWRKFQPNFYTKENGQKFIHASHYGGRGFNLNSWFPTSDSTLSHAPAIVGGLTGYGYTDSSGNLLRINYMMMLLRPFEYYKSFTPDDTPDCGLSNHQNHSNTDYTQLILATSGTREGGWQSFGNFGDSEWHYHEYHLKMNSAPGVPDGIYAYYIDGVCQTSHSNIPWIESGAKVGWNMVALGGNEDFQDTVPGGYEVFYAWDDLVISTNRVGSDYVISGSSSDMPEEPSPPPAPSGLIVTD